MNKIEIRLVNKARMLLELPHGESSLPEIVKILEEVYLWGNLDAKLPQWGSEECLLKVKHNVENSES